VIELKHMKSLVIIMLVSETKMYEKIVLAYKTVCD